MEQPNLTAEQKAHLDTHVAGIGHNLGPTLETIQEKVSQHSKLRAEATNIRVMFDMMRSHLSGEYLLPETTSAYVFGGLALVATMTGLAIVAQPVPISRKCRKRSEFPTTLTEDSAIAAAAMIGERRIPKNG